MIALPLPTLHSPATSFLHTRPIAVASGLVRLTIPAGDFYLPRHTFRYRQASVQCRSDAAATFPFAVQDFSIYLSVVLIADAARLTAAADFRSEEHTSELQSRENLVCRL